MTDTQTGLALLAAVCAEPVSGRVRPDGTVLLADGVIVPLDNCRVCEKVIRAD